MMKTFPVIRPLVCTVLVAAFALPMSLVAAPAGGKPAYTLFMGADIALEQDKVFYRVEDVAGSYFKIQIDGKEVLIPTRNGTARMRIDNALKLAGTPMLLENLIAERGYTPARDPRRKFASMSGEAPAAVAAADLSSFTSVRAEENLIGVQTMHQHSPAQITQEMVDLATSQRDRALHNEKFAYQAIGSDLASAAYLTGKMNDELAEENYDAMNVSLEVSSPVPLDDPYVLVIAQIHERDAKPDLFRNWVFAQKIDPIGAKPRKIYINQGGLPVGFELVDCQVRLYNHGRELPTNVSPKRVELTRDEAQQYVLIERLAARKDETVPPAPVFGEAPVDLRDRLAAGQFADPYYVKVDADGKVLGTFSDRDCSKRVDDAYVNEFVANVLFAPGLEKGKPVAGVARLQLRTLLN